MNVKLNQVPNHDPSPPSPEEKDAGLPVFIESHSLFAHASGALYWPRHEALIISDLHFEKGSHFATRQIFLPPYDTAATLERLSRLITLFAPRNVIALGDSFHDAAGPTRLSHADRATLGQLMGAVDWFWIAGNHDPKLPASLGGTFVDHLQLDGLSFRHEPQEENESAEIAGHLHPCARIRGRGRTVRSRCFIADEHRIILPAFGAFTGGLNVRDKAFAPFLTAQYQVYMMGSKKLFPLTRSACLPD